MAGSERVGKGWAGPGPDQGWTRAGPGPDRGRGRGLVQNWAQIWAGILKNWSGARFGSGCTGFQAKQSHDNPKQAKFHFWETQFGQILANLGLCWEHVAQFAGNHGIMGPNGEAAKMRAAK